jgi:hypothetical protein
MSPTLILRHPSSLPLPPLSPPPTTGRRRRFASMAATDSVSTGLVFVDALAQAPLPLPRPSSTALHRVAMTASAVTLRGGARMKTRQRLMRSSLTETGRTRSSHPFRYLSRTSRSTGLVATMSPARIPIGIRSRFTQAASGAFLPYYSQVACFPRHRRLLLYKVSQ